MRFKALRVAVAAVVALSLAVPAQASPRSDQPVSLGGKKVLLVNDDSVQAAKPDGSDGRGIYVLRQALCRAGADVAIVGPWAVQGGKGRSTAVSFTSSVAPPAAVPAEFAADCAGAPGHGLVLGACQGGTPCGPGSASLTPADVTELALTGILPQRLGWTTGPDLVLSGVNAGQKIEQTLRELAPDAEIYYERIAVTPEQIENWQMQLLAAGELHQRSGKLQAHVLARHCERKFGL